MVSWILESILNLPLEKNLYRFTSDIHLLHYGPLIITISSFYFIFNFKFNFMFLFFLCPRDNVKIDCKLRLEYKVPVKCDLYPRITILFYRVNLVIHADE